MYSIWVLMSLILSRFSPHIADIASLNSSQPTDKDLQECSTSLLCALSADIQHLWNRRRDSVVKVMGTKKGNDGSENLLFGTGFFADWEGNVLTTATIVTEAENLWVEYQELSYAAIIVGKDPVTNIAVISLLKKPEHFVPILLPECHTATAEITAEGSIVVAISCALGMEPAPIGGLITGKNIIWGSRVFATTYLRSDIGMCGGESGAPVFNSDGSLCGTLIASLPELHSSFIIPKHALARIFKDIVQHKNVSYCAAGFSARGQISEAGGKEVVISAIDAQKIRYSGMETLQLGDIIIKIDAQNIVHESDIADILFFKNPEDILHIQVIRNGKTFQIAIVLSEKTF